MEEFYTMKGYERNREEPLTSAMEDYLEMICRMLSETCVVRISILAERLHVKPSSASKMVNNLKEAGYIVFEKYGYITVTEKGNMQGEYLLYRHRVLHEFLCALNHSRDELEQVEKIEHFINRQTIENLEKITAKVLSEKEEKPGDF